MQKKALVVIDIQNDRTIKRAKAWVAAGIAAFSLSPIAASASSNETLTPPTVMVTPGEMESQNAGEVTPDPTLITNEYRQQTVVEIMNFEGPEPPPIPTEKVKNIFKDWKEQTFGPYEQELKNLGCNNENRLFFCASMLFNYDHSGSLTAANENGDRFQNYVTRQEIIDYALGGECDDVFCDANGKSRLWLVTADKSIRKRVRKNFSAVVDWYRDNGAPDILESISNNGVSVVFCGLVTPESSALSVYLNHAGTIWSNIDSSNIRSVKDNGLREILIRNLFVESYGIAYLRIITALGVGEFNTLGGCELVKSVIARNVAGSLESFDDLYAKFKRRYTATVDDLKKYMDGTVFGSPMSTRQLQLVFDVIDPIGFDNLNDVKGMREIVASGKN